MFIQTSGGTLWEIIFFDNGITPWAIYSAFELHMQNSTAPFNEIVFSSSVPGGTKKKNSNISKAAVKK